MEEDRERSGGLTRIYKLRKEELINELISLKLSAQGNVDDLRTRLLDYYKKQNITEFPGNHPVNMESTEEAADISQNKNLIGLFPPSNTTAAGGLPIQGTRFAVSTVPEPKLAIPSTATPLIPATSTILPPLSPIVPTLTTAAMTQPALTTIPPIMHTTVPTTTAAYWIPPYPQTVPYQLPPYYPIPPYYENANIKHIPAVTTEGEIIDKVRKWNIKFDQGNDPLNFLERVEELAECYQIAKDKLLKTLPELLTRKALIWYRNNRLNWQTWLDFTTDFRQFFLPPRYKERLADDIRYRMQKPGEPVREFVTAMQALQRWQDDVTMEQKLDRIYQNLLPKYRLYVRPKDFSSLAELMAAAEEFEHIKRDDRMQKHRKEQPVIEKRVANIPVIQNYSREECCWKCGQRGHKRTQCRNKGKLFCSKCGQEGTKTIDCTCQKQGKDQGVTTNGGNRPLQKITPPQKK